MRTIKFNCSEEQFRYWDIFLCEQEYEEKPEFDEIVIQCDNNTYKYAVENQFNKWYIVTK